MRPDNDPASLTLSPPGPLTVASGTTTAVTASVANKAGRSLSTPVNWSSSDPTIASVTGGSIAAMKVGNTTIVASSGTANASLSVKVTPGPATQLAIRTQPVGASVGSVLATQPVIEIRDAALNLVTSSTATVTATIASGGGTLGGNSTVAAVDGVATFVGLSISGSPGARTLAFSSNGLAAVTSASFTMTPPPTSVIALDNTAVTLTAVVGGTSPVASVRVTNAGQAPLVGLSFTTTYRAGEPSGWLSASLDSPNAPATLSLSGAPGALAPGTYHAVVQVSAPGASNSPTVDVTFTVAQSTTVTYGAPTERVKLLTVGSTFAPATSVVDPGGRPVTGVPLTFASRSSGVASVSNDGTITAVGTGDAWVTASTATKSDSVFVIVQQSEPAPIIRSNITNWSLPLGDTAFVNVVLDTRGTTVGSGLFAVAVQLQPTVFGPIVFTTPEGPPTPVVNKSSEGVYRVAVSAAAGMSGIIPLVNLKIVGKASGLAGWLTFTPLDVSGIDGTDITSQVTSTRLPLVIK